MKTLFMWLCLASSIFYCQNATSAEISNFQLYFETDQYELTEAMKEKILAQIQALPDIKTSYYFQVYGHTDNEGSKAYNQTLSENRAKSIESFIATQDFPSSNVFKRGFSYTQPIVANTSDQHKSKNRRVEVVISQANKEVPTLGNHTTPIQTKEIDPTVDTELYFESGTELFMPANTFVNERGELYTGKVSVQLQEIKDYKDFITSNIPMSHINGEEQYFVSSGMMTLNAEGSNGEQLAVAEDKEIDVKLAATSSEQDVQFYQFDPINEKWLEVQQALKRTPKRVKATRNRTVAVEMPGRCTNYKGLNIPFSDTTILANGVAFTGQNDLLSPELRAYYDANIGILTKKEALASIERAIGNRELLFKVSKVEEDNNYISIQASGNCKRSATELRSFPFRTWQVAKSDYNRLNTKSIYTDVELVETTSKQIKIAIVTESGERIEFYAEPVFNGSKSAYKRNLNNLATTFPLNKETRQEELVSLYEDKLEVESAINNLTKQRAECKSQFEASDSTLHQDLVDLFNVYNRAYISSNYLAKTEMDYMKWAKSMEANPEDYRYTFKNLLQNLLCRYKSTLVKNRQYKTVEQTYYTTASSQSYYDMTYAFKVNELGVYNVDRLKNLPNTHEILVERYMDDNNQEIFITSLFLVNSTENSVVKVNGLFGITPYNFKVEKKSNYGLVAIDIDGGSYKLPANEWDNQDYIEGEEFNLVMSAITAEDVGDFLAAN